ncbi:hypothetical protein HAX54_044338 [Datura stramonium]|uniref:Uncharacterized protein n=1 Tax=Datura stramonium TaxID=4076 RepID=A0ABS8SQK7_DATST|nr:hypothetical protein [Datura stramonium]
MAAAAASTSMAATAVFASRFPLCSTTKASPARCSALPYLPPRLSATSFSSSLKFAEAKRSSLLQVKASSSEESAAVDTSELLTDLKEKWDALDNKSTVIIYGELGGVYCCCLAVFNCCWCYQLSSFAPKNHGVGRSWIYWVVCLPLPSLQVK